MSKQTIQTLTNERVKLNVIEKKLSLLPRKRYISLALTSLEKGRMYLGEVCRELGHAYPYEATKKATTAEGIQPAVDIVDDKVMIGVNENEIVELNNLRKDLESHIEVLTVIIGETSKSVPSIKKFRLDCAYSEAYRSLKETRMWLGKRLGEIRDEHTK